MWGGEGRGGMGRRASVQTLLDLHDCTHLILFMSLYACFNNFIGAVFDALLQVSISN